MRPASTGSSRLTQRSSVDLPEPEAPIRQTTSCSATLEVDPAQHLVLAERLVHALDRDGAHATAPGRRLRRSRATSQSVKRASGIVIATKSVAATR